MAARPLPPPEPDPTKKKVRPTETAKAAITQPFLAKIRSIATAPELRTHLNTVMKMRWLRITGIAVAVLRNTACALSDQREQLPSEDRVGVDECLGRPVTLGELSLRLKRQSWRRMCIADDPAFSKSPFVQRSVEGGRRADATHLRRR
jgi:hypothetical protein